MTGAPVGAFKQFRIRQYIRFLQFLQRMLNSPRFRRFMLIVIRPFLYALLLGFGVAVVFGYTPKKIDPESKTAQLWRDIQATRSQRITVANVKDRDRALSQTTTWGMAGLGVLLLAAILTSPKSGAAVSIAIGCFAISVPLLVALGALSWLHFDEKGVPPTAQEIIYTTALTHMGQFLFCVGLGALVWSYDARAAIVFLVGCGIGLRVFQLFAVRHLRAQSRDAEPKSATPQGALIEQAPQLPSPPETTGPKLVSTVFDPNLDPELRATVEYCLHAVRVVLDAAAQIRHDQSDAQVHALAVYGTVIELFSACVGLAQLGEPTAIPIVLRSMYEAHVDLDNLLQDAGYVEHMLAAGLEQTLKIMESAPLRQLMKEGRKPEYDQLSAQLADFNCRGKGALSIWKRCRRAGRADEYESLYALFCMDTHNNTGALGERHVSENPDGGVLISFFGPYDPWAVIRRLDLGLGFLLGSARDMHGAFKVPAPQIDELAAQLDRVKAERAERDPGQQR